MELLRWKTRISVPWIKSSIGIALLAIVLLAISCGPTTNTTPDTTPPPTISGLLAIDAYDGRVNLSWNQSTAEDFDHYSVYVSKAEIVDVKRMTPSQEITDISTNTFQMAGLEVGTMCYFALTATDESSNENTQVGCVSTTPTQMPRGTVDPNIYVDIYQSDKAWPGTTLFADNYNSRIIEVNMLGEIIWEYDVPGGSSRLVEAKPLPNNNILYSVSGQGAYEVDRSGKIVWSYLTDKIDHDTERLTNGDTIFVFGFGDTKDDAQVTEVNPNGEVVWQWYAKDYFNKPPYDNMFIQGWAHTNAVQRLPNGDTLISPRNFGLVVEVDPKGGVVRTIGEGVLLDAHDPRILPNGNLLCMTALRLTWAPSLPFTPAAAPVRAVEIDPQTGQIVWQFVPPEGVTIPPNRGVERLSNGNTLITGGTAIMEVTPQNQIVWELRLKDVTGIVGRNVPFYTSFRTGIDK